MIALVITIVILIILAGVALNMLLGENGIINKAKTAKSENDKATATETMNLKITNVQISTYTEKQRMPTLKELADNFCKDNDFEKVIEKTAEVGAVGNLPKISNDNPTAIITKLKAYPYEFEINSSLQLASIDGVKVATVPANDDDTIVSMTKAELQDMINTAINSKMNNYSTTTEQVVGTWTDGKTIFQKTITNLNISMSWSDQKLTYSSEFNPLVSNVDKIINVPIIKCEPTSGGYIIMSADLRVRPNGNWALYGVEDYPITEITIQYTKTTPTSTNE